MAQITIPKPMNAIAVRKNVTYSSANVPAIADYVVCSLGVRILDEAGKPTSLRGLRVTIVNDEIAPVTPVSTVPYIWIEGSEFKFDTGYTYTFLDDGVVGYGLLVVI